MLTKTINQQPYAIKIIILRWLLMERFGLILSALGWLQWGPIVWMIMTVQEITCVVGKLLRLVLPLDKSAGTSTNSYST